jgi:hypothetical protein
LPCSGCNLSQEKTASHVCTQCLSLCPLGFLKFHSGYVM